MLSEVDWLCDKIKGKIFDKVKNEMLVTACNVVFTSDNNNNNNNNNDEFIQVCYSTGSCR